MGEYNDTDLAIDFFNGKREAFEEIYRQYYNRIYIFCVKLIDNREEAQDITIDTMNKLFLKHVHFDNIPNIRAFLYVAARNHCFNYLRHLKRQTDYKREYTNTYRDEEEQLKAAQITGELINEIYHYLESIPERSRKVIQLLYGEGLKYKEIADRLNISIKTVESQRDYGLKKLKKILSDRNLLPIWLM
jgi:RNA polymerase sigma-70 factor (ECF subfamily)